jgi:hypothetical protein
MPVGILWFDRAQGKPASLDRPDLNRLTAPYRSSHIGRVYFAGTKLESSTESSLCVFPKEAFVTAVIAVANALLPGTGAPGTRIALGFVGFLATLGIAIYELRNSQLYEAAIHRAKYLERRLGVPGSTSHGERPGLFNERPPYVDEKYWKGLSDEERSELKKDPARIPLMRFWTVRVKHDRGLALIYGAALGGWVYLIADGILSIAAGLGRSWPPGSPRLVAGIIGILGFLGTAAYFIHHDESRYRPQAPSVAGPAGASASLPAKPGEHQ